MSNSAQPATKTRPGFISGGLAFLKRQQRDWKVTVARTSLDRLAYQMVFPYLSIYIVALGASKTELGMVNAIGMIMAGLAGPYTGRFIDRIGPKKIYLVGISLMAVCYLTYGLARTWEVTMVAMIAYWLGFSTSIHSCATICGNCLVNRDRATGMMICETVTAGVLGMAGPVIGTWIVSQFGGVNPEGIRPLFFAGLIITIGTFAVVLTQLSGRTWLKGGQEKANIFQDTARILKSGHNLKRWLVITSVAQLPIGMVFPFAPVFAHQVKGADEFILGAMVTGSALSSVVFAIPLGRLADRVGRRRVLFITIPLFLASNLMLILAPSPTFLVLAGIMQGFYYIGSPIAAAIERELVPPESMGRWVGIARFVKMLFAALLALTAGLIWDQFGPQYIFITYIVIELGIRLPLLVSMPETLNQHFKSVQEAAPGH